MKIFPRTRDRQSLIRDKEKNTRHNFHEIRKVNKRANAQCSKVCMHIHMRQTQQTFMQLCMNNYPCLRAVHQKSSCLLYNTQNVDKLIHPQYIHKEVCVICTHVCMRVNLR